METRTQFFLVLICVCLSSVTHELSTAHGLENSTVPFHVGLVLDLDSLIGMVSQSSLSIGLSDFYAIHSDYSTRLVLHTRDSKEDTVGAASAVLDLLKNVEVQTIIGPQRSAEAEFVIDLGDRAQVPIVSFSVASPSLAHRSPYFVRTAQSDSCQIKAITAIIQAFQWREVVPVIEDTEYGNGFVPYLIDALQQVDVKVKYRISISITATDDQILEELYKLMTMENRVFVVHMTTRNSLVSRFFLKAKEAGMMSEGYVWIVTAATMNLLDSFDRDVIDAMQGVLGVKPFIPRSERLDNFTSRWKKAFLQQNPHLEGADQMNIYGLWAYDTAWALAMAAETVGVPNSNFHDSNVKGNLTNVDALGISETGPKLLKAVLERRFSGLGGEFHLADGELLSSAFQVLNVIGKGERVIGFWTPEFGISRELNKSTSERMYSVSRSAFRPIIWPGESTVIPKGWVIPVSGKKLRIGVPVNIAYAKFVKVEWDSQSNTTTAKGFCIDVFNAVMERMPYAVPYEFIPFAKPDGSSAGSRNDLVYQVYLQRNQNYDAVVGDTTILANRSLYVDFTLSYTQGGVMMIVPIKYEDEKNTSIFVKPLAMDLWLAIVAFFILTGLLVWFLEDQRKDDFRGEKMSSNLSRAVVIVWMVVMLILTSSYTASLSSILTVERLEPSATSIETLQKNRDYVGYQQGSFIFELLKQLKFDESRLMVCKSAADCDEALSKGSSNGGISAYFEIPCVMKVFLAAYCNKYTFIGPIHKTEGFGFVFPRGSPLVSDVSRAILNVTEGETFKETEQKWLGNPVTCTGPSTNVVSSRLTFRKVHGLFIIAGSIFGLTLLAHATIYLYNNDKHVFMVLSRLSVMFRRLRKRFNSYFIFKKKQGRREQIMDRSVEVSTDNICKCSLSGVSTRSSEIFGCPSMERMFTIENGDGSFESISSKDMVEVSLSE